MNLWIRFVSTYLIVALCGILTPAEVGVPAQAAPQQLSANLEKDRIAVTIDGKLFTCYKFAALQKYPYFWPVNGPASGKSVTTETSQPYPHHHSLFFGCDRVNGGNYWQEANERGQIVSQGPKIIESSGDRVVFTDKCFWRQPGKEPVILGLRRVVVTAPSEELRFIDFEISLKPLTDIRILKTNHSLFSARVVPELSVKSGGTLVRPARRARGLLPRLGAITAELATASRKALPSYSIRPTAGSRPNGSPAITVSSRPRRCSGLKKAGSNCPKAKC